MSPPLPPLQQIPPDIASVADYEAYARERMTPQNWAYLKG
ncbi:MAG: alpha-hydroxy-acid oxidizing protein, partial [Rubrivivax sp.]